jgi:hypothetical protein
VAHVIALVTPEDLDAFFEAQTKAEAEADGQASLGLTPQSE